jgi:hypothetical protein
VDEENVALLPPGTDLQHLSKNRRGLLSSQGQHLFDELHLLVVGELIGLQEPGP